MVLFMAGSHHALNFLTMPTGMLDKYRGGQCASCTYQTPSMVGNDGTMTITFTSPTTATVQLPGGRITQIQPETW